MKVVRINWSSLVFGLLCSAGAFVSPLSGQGAWEFTRGRRLGNLKDGVVLQIRSFGDGGEDRPEQPYHGLNEVLRVQTAGPRRVSVRVANTAVAKLASPESVIAAANQDAGFAGGGGGNFVAEFILEPGDLAGNTQVRIDAGEFVEDRDVYNVALVLPLDAAAPPSSNVYAGRIGRNEFAHEPLELIGSRLLHILFPWVDLVQSGGAGDGDPQRLSVVASGALKYHTRLLLWNQNLEGFETTFEGPFGWSTRFAVSIHCSSWEGSFEVPHGEGNRMSVGLDTAWSILVDAREVQAHPIDDAFAWPPEGIAMARNAHFVFGLFPQGSPELERFERRFRGEKGISGLSGSREYLSSRTAQDLVFRASSFMEIEVSYQMRGGTRGSARLDRHVASFPGGPHARPSRNLVEFAPGDLISLP